MSSFKVLNFAFIFVTCQPRPLLTKNMQLNSRLATWTKVFMLTLLFALSYPTVTFSQTYCTPSFADGCDGIDHIENFTFENINVTSACGASDYTPPPATVAYVNRGCTYTMSGIGNSSNKFAVWIDYNADSVFQASENVYLNNTNSTTFSVNLTIPVTASLSRMRIRVRNSDTETMTTGDACTAIDGYGESEDYYIEIEPELVPNAGPDQPNLMCANSTTLAGNDPGAIQGLWTDETAAPGGNATFGDPTQFNTTVTGLGPGANTLRWTWTGRNCTEFDEVVLTRSSVFSDAGTDQTLCTNNTTMDANVPGVGETGTWTLISGSGNITPVTSPTAAITNLGTGANVFEWTVTDGTCTVSDQVTINSTTLNTWTGLGAPNDWTDANNWDFGVPITCSNVLIAQTSNQPTISTAVDFNKLTIAAGAVLTIANTGTLELSDSLIIRGELNNSGEFSFNGAQTFVMEGTGTYVHNPVTIDNVSSIDIFVDGDESFSSTSTIEIVSWYDANVGLMENISGDIGSLIVAPVGESDIMNNANAPLNWYQNNTLQDHIKGDFTITNATINVVNSAAGIVPVAAFTDSAYLVVSGDIIINHANSELIGLAHTNASPTAPSTAAMYYQANKLIMTDGLIWGNQNSSNGNVEITGNIHINTTEGIHQSGGEIIVGFSGFGAKAAENIFINSDIFLSGDAVFTGFRNGDVNLRVNADTIKIEGTAIFKGQINGNTPATGTIHVTTNNTIIESGSFRGTEFGSAVVELNMGKVELLAGSGISEFAGIYGSNTNPNTNDHIINADSIIVSGASSVMYLNDRNSTGDITGTISGSVILNDGLFGLIREPGAASITIQEDLTIHGGEFLYVNPFNNVTNNALIELTVEGSFTMTGGLFDFEFITTNATATRILNVGGDFNYSGGTFRDVQETVSLLRFNGTNPQNIIGASNLAPYNIEFDNAAGVSVNNGGITVENQLTLSDGLVFLNNSNVVLEAGTPAIAGTHDNTTMFVTNGTGLLTRNIELDENFDFPIGDTLNGADFSPINIALSLGTYGPAASYSARTTGDKHPNNGSVDHYLNRYWHTESNDITGATFDVTATYVQSDVVGTETDVAHGTWSGALPWLREAVVDDANNELSYAGVSSLEEYSGIRLTSPIIDSISGDTIKCEMGDSVSLMVHVSGDPGYTYAWTPATGLSNVNIANPKAGPSVTTTYTVTVTDTNGQATQDTIRITVNPTPSAPTFTNPGPYCQFDAAPPLTADGTNHLWYTSATGGTGDPNAPSPGTSNIGDSSYFVTQTVDGCESDRTEIVIHVDPADDASFDYGGQTVFCNTGSSPAATVTGLAGGTFTSNPQVIIDGSTGVIDLAATTVGTHTVYYETNGPCPHKDSVIIDVVSNPDPSFTYPTPVCQFDANILPTFTTGSPSGTFSNMGGIVFVDVNTGEIDLAASTPGTETIFFDIPAGGGCPAAQGQFDVTINAQPLPPTVNTPVNYCQNDAAVPLTATGSNILWYSASAGGTGDANAPTPSTATIGNEFFYVSQTVNGCESARDSIEVIVNGPDDPSFTYASNSYAQNQPDPTPTVTGLAGGTFTGDNGLIINSSTGEIDLSANAAGSYTVTYTTNGPCPSSTTFSITITAASGCFASFTYPSPICENSPNPVATLSSGVGPGGFASNDVTILDASTGEVDMSTATVGTHRIYYGVTSGPCAGTVDSFDLVINATPANPTFTSPIDYCLNDAATQLSATGSNILWYQNTTGGTGDANAPTPSTATSGTFYFYVSQTVNGCESDRDSVEVNVNEDDASFAYSSNTYSQSQADPTPTVTGLTGGTFTGDNGLIINSTTGEIDLSANATGTYVVTYTTNGPCPSSETFTVTITTAPTCQASFTYPTPVCASNSNPIGTPDAGSGVGTYSSNDVIILDVNTGEIDLSTATAGSKRVYYTISSGACAGTVDSFDVVIEVTPMPGITTPVQYCENETATPLSATGTNVLWYTQGAGGVGDPNAPTPFTGTTGTFNFYVTQTLNGCESRRDTIVVNVNPYDDATVTYFSNGYCIDDTDPIPTTIVTPGGTFSSPNGLVVNPSTGEIDLSASGTGTYDLEYTTNGACPSTFTLPMEIDTFIDGSFFYAGNFCQGTNASNPMPTMGTNAQTGTFSATPAGLVFVDVNTGEIDINASTPGDYVITNTTQSSGACPTGNHTSNIRINSQASIFVPDTTIDCGDEILLETSVNISGGTYFWEPGGQVTSSITVSPEQTTDFIVEYDAGNGCVATDTSTVTVNGLTVTLEPFDPACKNHPAYVLTGGQPAGGFYSGPTVNNGIFYPSQANVGVNTITYFYQDAGCTGSAEQDILVEECLGLEEPSAQLGFSILPNPSNGQFKLVLDHPVDGQIQIQSVNGQVVMESNLKNVQILNLNGTTWANGVYLINIQTESGQSTKRLIIQH